MTEQNLNPDALGRMFATAMMEVLDAEKLQPGDRLVHVNDMQEVLNRLEKRILSALPAQPDTVNSVEELVMTRTGLALANTAFGEGLSAGIRACNAADSGQPFKKPVSPYSAPLLAMIKADRPVK